jgi:hypothetical protein
VRNMLSGTARDFQDQPFFRQRTAQYVEDRPLISLGRS